MEITIAIIIVMIVIVMLIVCRCRIGRRRCAWCGEDLGLAMIANPSSGRVTHGICEPCATQWIEEAKDATGVE